jgi:hypothetical protein
MADEPTEYEIRDAQMIVVGAIAAAGNMNSSVAWKSRLNQLIPEVAAVLGPRSFQMRRALAMLDAAVFTAPFVDAVLEESSTRMVVSVEHPIDKDHPDGRQRLRTERTDTPTGKRMAERLHDVRPGQTLLCWKVHEEMRSGENAGRSVAVLMHIEVLPDRAPGGGGSQARASGSSSSPAPAPATGEIESDTATKRFSELTKEWPSRSVAAFVADLRSRGAWPPSEGTIETIAKEAEEWAF